MFGELFATALQVRGLITEGGGRDMAELHAMGFPVWSAAVSAQGTVRATPGAVNVPITVGGQLVRPADAILTDGDVMCVPRQDISLALDAAQTRVDKEQASRKAFWPGNWAWTVTDCGQSWPDLASNMPPPMSMACDRTDPPHADTQWHLKDAGFLAARTLPSSAGAEYPFLADTAGEREQTPT